MPKLTVAQYADQTVRPEVTIETGVTYRVRNVRNSVQRQWRYRYTIHGRRDEITLPASGFYREHMAEDLRRIAEYKDLVRQGINPKRHRETQYRNNQRRQRTFKEVALEYLPNYQSRFSNFSFLISPGRRRSMTKKVTKMANETSPQNMDSESLIGIYL